MTLNHIPARLCTRRRHDHDEHIANTTNTFRAFLGVTAAALIMMTRMICGVWPAVAIGVARSALRNTVLASHIMGCLAARFSPSATRVWLNQLDAARAGTTSMHDVNAGVDHHGCRLPVVRRLNRRGRRRQCTSTAGVRPFATTRW